MKIIIIGGGAAGFFAALAAKDVNPNADVLILEKTAKLLSKVRVSGGGRCNVTHGCFDPKLLIQHYPRGSKEILGPFHTFQPRDTIAWFKKRGVTLKEEKDGRMFPDTDFSATIIDCFMEEAKKLGVVIWTQSKLRSIRKVEKGFELETDSKIYADRVILATGSAKAGWEFAKELGHTIVPSVPSLFTFNVSDFPLIDLSGVSCPAKLTIKGSKLQQEGPLLITHWGFSGPATLKLSAWGARYLAEKNYEITLLIDWLPDVTEEEIRQRIKKPPLPKKLWKALLERAGATQQILSKSAITKLCETLKREQYSVRGKTTNKEEFVTCGGITLSEVNFKTMESKVCKNLFFCGEVLNIDGVTGGFNFQNAWTTGYIAGTAGAPARAS